MVDVNLQPNYSSLCYGMFHQKNRKYIEIYQNTKHESLWMDCTRRGLAIMAILFAQKMFPLDTTVF